MTRTKDQRNEALKKALIKHLWKCLDESEYLDTQYQTDLNWMILRIDNCKDYAKLFDEHEFKIYGIKKSDWMVE